MFRLICYCISHVCMMGFLFAFTRSRFSSKKTAGIVALSAAALLAMELLGFLYTPPKLLLLGLQILTLQGTSLFISDYRDARGLFTGLGASNYVLPGVMTSLYLYVVTGWGTAVLIFGLAIHLLVLGVLVHSLLPAYREIQKEQKERWPMLCLMPVFFYLTAMGLELAVRESGRPVSALFTVIFFLMGMYASYLLVFRMMQKLRQDQQAVKEREILKSGIRALRWEEKKLRAAEKDIAAHIEWRRKYVGQMQVRLEKQDYDGVRQILAQMEEMSEVHQTRRYCNNAPVNGVMIYYMSEAQQLGIAVSVRMDFPKELRVSDWELAVVIGNLMDNALFACKKLPEGVQGRIQVTARTAHRQFLLEIRNTCLEPVVFDPETGIPVSNRGADHGIGMQSIAYFAEKNQAIFDCGIEKEEFFVRLLI